MASKSLTADGVLDELKKCGITHIVWLPDSEARFMYDAMMSQNDITLVPICREGEAIAIAAGLTLGGKKPVVLHQNTGFFESGDSIRGLGLDLPLPLLLLIGYRGWQRHAPITDSAAIFLEPILDTWGINHYLIETDDDLTRLSDGYKETQETNKPVAILIGKEYQ
ncbi:thiamine pyrophosphate-binding protein [Chloroflexota bacterium]